MPTTVSSNPHSDKRDGQGVELPIAEHYERAVRCLVGRDLTIAEQQQLDKMARHNWTVRIAAEAIIGRDLSHEEFEARKATDPDAFAIK